MARSHLEALPILTKLVLMNDSTETAEAAKLAAAEEISTGWKDKTTTQTTLHLTHLPPNLTSPQLSLICSSYAPLRSAFVVSTSSNNGDDSAKLEGVSSANATKTGAGRDRTGKSASRGFGYVRFVLRTDAEKCIVDWGTEMGIPRSALKGIEGIEGSEGIEWDKVCGRGGIKMAWAKKKLKEGEEPEGGVKEKKIKEKKQKVEKIDYDAEDAPARPVSASGYDREGSRTVIVQGLSVPLTEEEIEAEKERKAAKMEVDTDDDAEEIAEDAEEKEEVNEDSMVVDGKEVVAGKEIDWKKALKQKAKKWGDVESVSWPVVLPSGETVGKFFTSSSDLYTF
jgi:nucleolar protein 4